MRRAWPALLALTGAALPAPAEAASTYNNARYGYSLDIPSGFGPVHEAENGDGGTAHSSTADAALCCGVRRTG